MPCMLPSRRRRRPRTRRRRCRLPRLPLLLLPFLSLLPLLPQGFGGPGIGRGGTVGAARAHTSHSWAPVEDVQHICMRAGMTQCMGRGMAGCVLFPLKRHLPRLHPLFIPPDVKVLCTDSSPSRSLPSHQSYPRVCFTVHCPQAAPLPFPPTLSCLPQRVNTASRCTVC